MFQHRNLIRGLIVPALDYIHVKYNETNLYKIIRVRSSWGWSYGAKVLGKLQCGGVLLFWLIEGQGPIALAVADEGCLDSFFPSFIFICFFSFLSSGLRDGPI